MKNACVLISISGPSHTNAYAFQEGQDWESRARELADARCGDSPDDVIKNLKQRGSHAEGDYHLLLTSLDFPLGFLAVTQPDCTPEKLEETLVESMRANFETFHRAAVAEDTVLLECKLNSTGESVAVVCAVSTREADQGSNPTIVSPFALMLAGNPYEMLTPIEEGDDG